MKQTNLSIFQWIQDETDRGAKNSNCSYVSNFIPKRYSHYCKILHPIYRDNNIKDEHLLWNQGNPCEYAPFHFGERLTFKRLVEKYGLTLTKEISSQTFYHKLGGFPRYFICADEGTMDKETFQRVVEILKPFTSSQTCYFHYDLVKLVDLSENDGKGLFFEGLLEDVWDLYNNDEIVRGSPNYWWPTDKSWCLYTDLDLDFTIVGGSKELVNRMMDDKFLECVEVEESTRIDWKADQMNVHGGKR